MATRPHSRSLNQMVALRATAPAEIRHDRCYLFRVFELDGQWGPRRRWVAAMPDVHWGVGATVGSVIPTVGAIIPAAVGVDIGCGMAAVRTTLTASDLPDNLREVRAAIERAVPHGRSPRGRDKGAWEHPPAPALEAWQRLKPRFETITSKHGKIKNSNNVVHLGTLGTGNHFIEVCLDEADHVWFMLHSGSRGVGNKIGTYFIELAKQDMRQHLANLRSEERR